MLCLSEPVAPRGKDLPKLENREAVKDHVHIGIDWLASVAFGHY
jgi:hypothetical protein